MQSSLIIAASIFCAVSSQPSPYRYDNSIGNVAWYYAFSSYCSVPTIKDWELKGSPPNEVQQFEPTAIITTDLDTLLQCFVGWDPVRSRIIISFRGSRSNFQNWVKGNLNIAPIKYENDHDETGAEVHRGFYNFFGELGKAGLTEAILEIIYNHPGADIFLTGHSLGGAMASICALELEMSSQYRNFPIGAIDVITFGSPRWGNERAVKLFHEIVRTSWRIVNGDDVVAAIPPESFGYRHVGTQIQYKEGSDSQFFVCDGSGSDNSCHGAEFGDIFGFDGAAHNAYFGRRRRKICACDDEYTRGEGRGLHACPASHPEEDAALCYPRCNDGYVGVGPVCWERCSANEVNDGAFCRTPLVSVPKRSYVRGPSIANGCGAHKINQNGLCYNRCQSGYRLEGPLCLRNCDSGYSDHGLTCYKHVFDFYFKSSYGNGVGTIPNDCPSGKEKASDGLCYTPCNAGFVGVLGVCWERCDGINRGALCETQSLSIRAKKTYARGVGVPLQCAPDEDQEAIVCYPKCRNGFTGVARKCTPYTCVTPTARPTSTPTRSPTPAPIHFDRIYIGHNGKQCEGSSTDILRDYIGTAYECQAKCDELNCVGFVRVNSGRPSNTGRCYFRGGKIGNPYAYADDNRDCYIPTARTSKGIADLLLPRLSSGLRS